MKNLTSYNRATQYLNKVFKLINTEYFDGKLEMPTITIQSSVASYGHISVSKVWKTENGNDSYELNVSADYLSRPIENVVATLIHECCHLYAMMNGIRDTSNQSIYHNKKFKEIAENKGHLIIERHEKYGWTITSPSEETLDFCIRNDLQDILISRNSFTGFAITGTPKAGNATPTATPATPKKPKSIKWVCPCCGAIVRSGKILNIVCGDCNEKFIQA